MCPLGVLQDAALWVRRRFVKTSFAARPTRWYLRGTALAACVVLFLAGFLVLRKWKVNPIYVMAGCGLAGLILYTVF